MSVPSSRYRPFSKIIFAAAIIFWSAPGIQTLAAETKRPNVLLILVDDLKPTLGCYGDRVAKSPNLDALARRSMRFELAYCNQAVCAPSRFTLMLGSHSTSTGLYGLGSQLRQIVPDAVTMPQHFAAHGGYRTESLGKVFHIGHGNEGDPESFSVPHFKDKVIEYLDPASTDGGKLTREEALFTNQKLGQIKSLPRGAAYELPVAADTDYADGRVAVETIQRLRAAKQRRENDETPFFIAAGFVRPHMPFSAPKKYWDLYDSSSLPMPEIRTFPSGAPDVALKRRGEVTAYKPVPVDGNIDDKLTRTLIHGYYASVSYVDAQIGKVIDELDRLDLSDNTIIVLWGDHGFHLGDHSIWTKHTNYEQANRIPIMISAPGVTNPNSSSRQPAETVDLFPTLAQLAGLPAPKGPQRIDGVSLVPVLKDPAARVRDHAFHAYPKQKLGRAIRTERYRMVQWLAVGDDWENAEYELYDYQTDPLESKNIADTNPETLSQLKSILAKYPDPVSRKAPPRNKNTSPKISNREISIDAIIRAKDPRGVVLAQGGREHGYALHFVDGVAALDVRIHGQVSRLKSSESVSGKAVLRATIDRQQLTLTVNGKSTSCVSPGLIPVEPIDELSIGEDTQSAAGDYSAPNAFNGTVVSHRIESKKVESKFRTPAALQPPASTRVGHADRWPLEKVNRWYDKILWPVGTNFVPSTAGNQLEMWQAETFDPATIDRELGWAAEIGMNTMRVFLHDLAWKQDPEGFLQRVDDYLSIADKHGIRTMLVLFDGVWNPYPKPGKQPLPVPRVHNSIWVQSPGREILEDADRHDELEPYVTAVVSRFRDDNRVLIWDLFNEPDNSNAGNFGGNSVAPEMPEDLKRKRSAQLLEKTFAWVRQVNPSQPLTAGVWGGPVWLNEPDEIERLSLTHSDVISFHTYDGVDATERMVRGLLAYGRPLMCTEYLARGNRSTFDSILPIFNRHKVAAYNWGLVDGKSQTIYPWHSWNEKFTAEPELWHHDIFRRDGTPYSQKETKLIRRLLMQPPTQQSNRPPVTSPDDPQRIRAGLAAHDRALFIKSGWIRDPYISLGPNGSYYLTGTTPLPDDPRQHTDPYNLGLGDLSLVGWKLQVWRSDDLVTWESLGTPYTLKDGIWATANLDAFENTPQPQWRLWAPELHWLGDHPLGPRWALVHTSPSPVAGANLSLTSGAQVTGPWTNPLGAGIKKRHDPSLFRDDDGTWWMIWGATSIAPLQPDFSGFAAQPIKIGPSGESKAMGHEGCLMHKIGNKYVLFGTGWSTGTMRRGSYNLYYATADKISGPYSERKFVGRFLGHGTPFQDKQGRWWCTGFFNANVPPIDATDIESRDIGRYAQTINQQGVTLVPLDVKIRDDGEIHIRAKAPGYSRPGPDEAQKFDL